MSLGFRHIAATSLALLLVGCGSDLSETERTEAGAESQAAASTAPDQDGAGKGDGTASDTTGGTKPARNADGSPLEITGRQLCDDLPPQAASQALGVEVDAAQPGDNATPLCTYSYAGADGNDSTFTLAAMRPADIGGRTGLEAFDYMVELSRGLAGPVDLDQEDLKAGDKAVRITGGDIHTGVVASGGHLLTVTVPERDADTAEVDALVTAVGKALA